MINQEIVLKNCIDYVKDYVGNDYTYAYPSDKFFKKRHYPYMSCRFWLRLYKRQFSLKNYKRYLDAAFSFLTVGVS